MKHLGKQPPRYSFFLNPYRDVRFTRCPRCNAKTRMQKTPLIIHVDPLNPVALNKTCRYCKGCDLLIVHQDELEDQLVHLFTGLKPEVVGNDYLVLGTIDRSTWRQSIRTPLTIQEMLDALHVFREVLRFGPLLDQKSR